MIRNRKLLYLIFALVIAVGLFNYAASTFHLYWDVSWFDNFVHFLGGLAIGLIGVWIFYVQGVFFKGRPTLKRGIITSLVFVMIIGIGWEIFEYIIGATQSTESYPLDVFHDLLSDALGAVVAGYIGVKKKFYNA